MSSDRSADPGSVAPLAPAATAFGAFLRLLGGEIRHHALLIAYIAIYCVLAMTAISLYATSQDFVFKTYVVAALVPPLLLALVRIVGELMHHAFHVRPFRWTGVREGLARSEIFSLQRLAAGVVPVVMLPLFSGVFSSFKMAIPDIVPFTWDRTLMNVDKALHFGEHPWVLLQPILGYPPISSALSYLYSLWIPLMWLIVYWQIFHTRDRVLRMRFLMSFVLVWSVLGSGFALGFSSVGPCFYGHFVDGPNPYADLMRYLEMTNDTLYNWSVIGQSYLLQGYQMEDGRAGGGISAMPSLHVCVAVLLFLLSRYYGRRAAFLLGAYAVIIMIGSVHLGWHYAIDGYAGAAGAVAAWKASRWLVRLVPPTPVADDGAGGQDSVRAAALSS